MKLIIGLTGGIASGKSTVSSYLADKGVFIVDADIVSREVVAPHSVVTKAIENLLGKAYILNNGQLDRKKIKQLIFNQPKIKSQYEAIILPAIREALLSKISHIPSASPYCLCVVPLLFEKGFDQFVDYTVCVDIEVEQQVKRACERNPKDKEVIQQIISSQMPREERIRRSDYVVDNTQGIDELHQQIQKLHQWLSDLSIEALE